MGARRFTTAGVSSSASGKAGVRSRWGIDFSWRRRRNVPWRRDGGAWSADTAMAPRARCAGRWVEPCNSSPVRDGFRHGDAWAFDVKQPHAPRLAKAPDRGAWRWSGSGADWTADFRGRTPMTPWRCGVTASPGGDLHRFRFGRHRCGAVGASYPLSPRSRRGDLEGPDGMSASHRLRASVSGAAGGSVRWVWCGGP